MLYEVITDGNQLGIAGPGADEMDRLQIDTPSKSANGKGRRAKGLNPFAVSLWPLAGFSYNQQRQVIKLLSDQ